MAKLLCYDSAKTQPILVAGGDVSTAPRTLTVNMGDADRTLDIADIDAALASAVSLPIAESDVTGLVSDLGTLASAVSGKASTTHAASHKTGGADLLATGTPDGTKFLRDDFSWQTPAGGSGLTYPQILSAVSLRA